MFLRVGERNTGGQAQFIYFTEGSKGIPWTVLFGVREYLCERVQCVVLLKIYFYFNFPSNIRAPLVLKLDFNSETLFKTAPQDLRVKPP